jgi:hypothetical protein
MRPTAFFRELVRDVISGTGRAGLFGSLSILVLGLVVIAEVLTASALARQAIEYRVAGAAITTVALPGRVDGRACEALANSPGVLAAGALRAAVPTTLVAIPDSPLEQYETTPSLARLLRATDAGRGAYFSQDVVDVVGQTVATIEGGNIPVRGTFSYPADGRRPGFGWAMLSPMRPGDGAFDECWIEVWPERKDTRRLLLTAISPGNSVDPAAEPQVSQLNGAHGVDFSGVASYENRPTRFAPLVALLIGSLLGGISVRMRRVEIAANLHAGASRRMLIVQQTVEAAAWALPAAVCGWAIGCVIAVSQAPQELAALARGSAHIGAAFLLGALWGAWVGTVLVRESQLWSYVKSR